MEELAILLEEYIVCSRYTTTAQRPGELRVCSSSGSRGRVIKIA